MGRFASGVRVEHSERAAGFPRFLPFECRAAFDGLGSEPSSDSFTQMTDKRRKAAVDVGRSAISGLNVSLF